MAMADWFYEDGKDQKSINNAAKFINTADPAAQRSLFLSIDNQPELRVLFNKLPHTEKISTSKPAMEKSGLLVRKSYFTAEQSI